MKQLKDNEITFIKSLEILDVLLLSSEHKIHSLFAKEELLVDFTKKNDLNLVIDDDLIVFEIEASLKIFDKKDETKLLLESEAKFATVYAYDKNILGEDKEKIEKFAINFFQFSAITHILAFAREYFYTILIKSGYPRITLPLIKSLLDEEAEVEASKEIKHM